ncbi:G5 domain-containing protein [Patescibacteria group bacterium]|nr:G5 domain-containing protein [Patescibacteria group bacterium]
MDKYLGIILIIALTIFAKSLWQTPEVLGESSNKQILPVNQSVTTESSFTEKLQEEIEVISRTIIYQDDPETELGEDKVLEEGADGKKIKIFKITYSKDGEEYERELQSVETIPAKEKKILRGTKIVWRVLQTPDGEIKYWKKLRVWATHYDSNCDGCNEWTATGMRQGKGVIAVDPAIIKLRSKVYIPGYGTAIAGDTGGRIEGNIIDLGFDDAKTAGWSAKFIDIYLL